MDDRAISTDEDNSKRAPITFRTTRLKWFYLIGGAAVLLIWAWATSWLSPIIEPDINQHRRNTILPTPQETSQIRQTFVSDRNGLSEVEVKVARQETAETEGRLELQLLNQAGTIITAESLESSALIHEQVYVLRFEPQPDSAGQRYTLLVSGTANNDVSLWGYDLDVHSGGELTFLGGETAAQDLYLITRYRLTLSGAVESLSQALTTFGSLTLLALGYMLMPGCFLLVIWQRKIKILGLGPSTWLGLALAIGISVWPILWQSLSLVGGRWSAVLLWIVLALGWAAFLFYATRLRQNNPTSQMPKPAAKTQLRITKYEVLLFLIILIGIAVRFLAVRDQAFPLWVDASRHGLITAVMADTGQVIQDYHPWLAVDRFPYHYGFHTISAGLVQMTGWPLPELLLGLGQLLNGLVPLTVYGATYIVSRRRLAALTAAFLVALPFFFPAYYATWGRMTQLTGVLVLPMLLALTWQLVRGSSRWRSIWWLVSLLAAGLFLIHFRVFLLYLVFAGVVWLFSFGRNGRRLVLAGLLTLLLIAPRLWQLLADINPARAVSNSLPGYNDFPTGYVTVGWERPFLWLGGVATLLAIIAVVRRRQWGFMPLFLVVWAGGTAVLLSGSRLGLPETSLININSAYIVLFVPLALLLGIVGERLWHWIMARHWFIQAGGSLIIGAGLAGAAVFGLHQQLTILNSETILALPADQAGLTWLAENTPADSKFVVNAFSWLGTTWTGQDGGAWIVPLTGRASTTPPADYIYAPALAISVNDFNNDVRSWGSWADPVIAALLREQGVTHVFVGARGGTIDPAELARNPEMAIRFGQDGVFVFALTEDER